MFALSRPDPRPIGRPLRKAGASVLALLVTVALVVVSITGSASASAGSTATADTSTAAVTNRFRTVTDFDPGWLFNYGDASGASGASYVDGGWRRLSVPHDWS